MALIRINPAGDLALENGDLVWVGGVDFYRQALACRFRFFLGEWFLDLRQGFPYHRDVFGKGVDLSVVRSDFRQTILTTDGITALSSLDLTLDRPSRSLAVSFSAMSVAGPVIVAPGADDFIVRF